MCEFRVTAGAHAVAFLMVLQGLIFEVETGDLEMLESPLSGKEKTGVDVSLSASKTMSDSVINLLFS